MGKVEKITIKLAMLFIGLSLLFPARVLAAEKNEINEITEKKQIIFLLDASKSMQGGRQCMHDSVGVAERIRSGIAGI